MGVGRFVVGRLLQMLLTLAIATFVLFAAVTVLPGDPVRGLFGPKPPPPDVYAAISADFHLDRPFLAQYGLFVSDLLRGDLGHSYPDNPFGTATQGPPVASILARTLPVSLRIVGATLALQAVVGTVVGVATVLLPRRISVATTYATAVLLVSVPVIVAAYALQAFVGFEIAWLPYRWIRGAGWRNYVLPVASLAAGYAAYTLLLVRSELHATLRRPFVRAAAARGLAPRRIVGVHALRAGAVPVVTFLTANLGNVIAGLVVVEGIFGIPGTGGALFRALERQDRALIVVVVVLILAAVVVANTLTDLAYGLIDPRVRADR